METLPGDTEWHSYEVHMPADQHTHCTPQRSYTAKPAAACWHCFRRTPVRIDGSNGVGPVHKCSQVSPRSQAQPQWSTASHHPTPKHLTNTPQPCSAPVWLLVGAVSATAATLPLSPPVRQTQQARPAAAPQAVPHVPADHWDPAG